MTKTHLTHELAPLFEDALCLYDVVDELATTRRRVINELMMAHVIRLLHHAGCAVSEKKGPALDCRLHYGRLTLTKLATVVEAARRSALITEEQSQRARTLMLSMEQMLMPTDPPTSEQTETETVRANGDDGKRAPATMTVGLPEDVLADLRELIDRDSRPEPLDDRDDGAAPWPAYVAVPGAAPPAAPP